MAKEGVKFLYGSAIVIGIVAVVQYFSRQKRLLKDICVSNTSFDWQSILSGLLSSENASSTSGVPLTLSVVNNSDIDVTLKEIDLAVTVDGQNLGYVELGEEVQLLANSETMLDLNITITVDDLLGLGLSLLIPPNVYKIRGNFVISASVFETLKYPYLLVMTGSQLTEEVSGDCVLS
jgi:LEA14-like dessication related protein